MEYDSKHKNYSSDSPYFRFLNQEKAEILGATVYDTRIGDVMKFDYGTQKLNYFRQGKLRMQETIGDHEFAVKEYKKKYGIR